MTGCRRQCDWDDNQVCRSCGIDYSPPKPPEESSQNEASKSEAGAEESASTKSDDEELSEESEPHETGKPLRPFHLAFPVDDLPAARKFYTEVLGCTTGREKEESCVFNFYGHQIVAHRVPKMPNLSTNPVDGKKVPQRWFIIGIKRGDELEGSENEALLEDMDAAIQKAASQPKVILKDLLEGTSRRGSPVSDTEKQALVIWDKYLLVG